MLSLFLIFAMVGVIAGLIAGLFGLGGGVIMVPALIYTFGIIGVGSEVSTHLAIGTSLACIVFTASMATWTHWQKHAVEWPLLKWLVPGVVIGAALGGKIAVFLNGVELRIAFAIFLIAIALKMLFTIPAGQARAISAWVLSSVAVVIGAISSLFGVGGGAMTVPFLRSFGTPMARAVATGAALGLPLAISGSMAYIYQGWGREGLPEGAVGFVFLPAALGMLICSVPTSRLGAQLAHKLPGEKLQRAFAIIMLVIASELLVSGVITLIGQSGAS